ncbi:MAG: DUF3365 domain-containing protein [Planctomycetota bacterium]|nr:DUF3365 domain-containing protein [Planctomycetota bacterium]MDA1212243.1 DUF3365 domain-containing protein [Planctomycetota bacterium]
MLKSRITGMMLMAMVIVSAGVWVTQSSQGADKDAKKSSVNKKALERTRKQVKMLDDVYKTAVVLITDKYVNDEDDFPAGGAAVALFSAIKEKGWHEVRILDATGQPYDEDNVAKDDFDKGAVEKLVAGDEYVEEVTEIDGVPYLRAATPIPVVLEKCIMCHPHYADVKKGQAIGLLSYTLKIE